MSEGALTAGGYITHHLTHLSSLTVADPHAKQFIVDMSVINFDTLFFSTCLMLLLAWGLSRASRKATSGVPGKFQCAVEMLVEFVNEQAKSVVHGDRSFVAPMGLFVFCWVTLMNTIDLIPVDLIPEISKFLGINIIRPLPTADLNGTLGISLSVLLLCLYYGVKNHGGLGFLHSLLVHPFGANPLLWPFNFIMNIIEYFSKTVSLAMRLFGNMYAGELLFFLIALLGGCLWGNPVGFAAGAVGQVIAGLGWWLFHLLIVLLQAFIMMMLSLVYIGQSFGEE